MGSWRCRAEHLPALLSPTFLRVLVNALSHADAHLHAAGRRLLERLAAHAAAAPDPTARVSVAVALARCSGGGFDRLTGTRTAAQLLQARGSAGEMCQLYDVACRAWGSAHLAKGPTTEFGQTLKPSHCFLSYGALRGYSAAA